MVLECPFKLCGHGVIGSLSLGGFQRLVNRFKDDNLPSESILDDLHLIAYRFRQTSSRASDDRLFASCWLAVYDINPEYMLSQLRHIPNFPQTLKCLIDFKFSIHVDVQRIGGFVVRYSFCTVIDGMNSVWGI